MKNTTAMSDPLYQESKCFPINPQGRFAFRSHRPEPGPCTLSKEKGQLGNSGDDLVVSKVEKEGRGVFIEYGDHECCFSNLSNSVSFWEHVCCDS